MSGIPIFRLSPTLQGREISVDTFAVREYNIVIMLKRTPLFDEHVKLKARMVEFGGWEMPVS